MKQRTQNIILFLVTFLAVFADLHYQAGELFAHSANGVSFFWEFRVPRVMGAVGAGVLLSVAGILMQTLFRNPLAGPYLVGVTPGASFGIAVSLFAQPWLTSLGFTLGMDSLLASVLGALLAMSIQLALNKGFENTTKLLLTGMVLSFLFGAAVDLLQNIGNMEQIKQFTLWGMGSFERVTRDQLIWILIPSLLGIALSWSLRHALDTYLLGDQYAQTSGVNIRGLRRSMIWIGAILSGWATAFCGPVSFVGLVAPHIAKRLARSDSHGKILLPSVLWGIFICVTADLLAHALIPGITLQVNAICAIIGAPILLSSFRKRRDW